ncbi:phytanoyl-CoA dioxygenase domain-containing protein 1 homolog isoform X1 [Argopecten irradians]|uniref:phytanoyl-CoA dioxygenase domain-containing protein 1 homolog isoform X1 n=1 Tax=Argopecten irradians TaxID=31199 RepID=UPI0037205F4C
MADIKTPIPNGFTGETNPQLFNLDAKPPSSNVPKPGQLSEDKIRQFFEDGYVIVENFFKPEELDPCKTAINDMLDEMAEQFLAKGKIKELYKEYGFYERLTMIERDFPGANIVLHKLGRLPQAFKNLWTNERLLNVVEQLIGPDIAGHPVWNLRTKTPQNEATTVPWHQDSAYLDNESYKVLQPTAWIPLIDATEQNGCMQVAHRGHKTGKVATHQCCYGGTWYVMLEEDEMAKSLDVNIETDIKTCPIPYGGMLLLNNMIPHRSLPNLSKQIRWSLDLRWQKPSLPFGFYNMKEGVLMRTSNDPNYEVKWDLFEGVDRHDKQRESVKEILEPSTDPDFDTTIQGPWMKKWEIVHMNQHTSKLTDETMSSWHGHKA